MTDENPWMPTTSASNLRLEDRVAFFLQSLETSSSTNACPPRWNSTPAGTNVAEQQNRERLAHEVAIQPQVLVIVEGQSHDEGPKPLTLDVSSAPTSSGREKRPRVEISSPQDIPTHRAVDPFTQPSPVSRPRPSLPRTCSESRRCFTTMPMSSGASLEFPFLKPSLPNDTDALRFTSAFSTVGTDFTTIGASNGISGTSRMSGVEKAKLDWETHITAMEQVLAANREQGLPAGSISSDALQLLSQMVSNLYTLNSKLLYAQSQHILDTHRHNIERINKVFQGLAGVKKRKSAKR